MFDGALYNVEYSVSATCMIGELYIATVPVYAWLVLNPSLVSRRVFISDVYIISVPAFQSSHNNPNSSDAMEQP